MTNFDRLARLDRSLVLVSVCLLVLLLIEVGLSLAENWYRAGYRQALLEIDMALSVRDANYNTSD